MGTTLYTATTDNCGGAANGVYALDLASESKAVSTWDAKGAAIAGTVAPAFGTDGTVYVSTGTGGGNYVNAVVALDPAGLTAKDWFTGTAPFVSAPVVFQANGKDMIAAASKDGRLYVLDSGSLGGADHKTPLAMAAFSAAADDTTGALATWQDADGTRWIAVPCERHPGPRPRCPPPTARSRQARSSRSRSPARTSRFSKRGGCRATCPRRRRR